MYLPSFPDAPTMQTLILAVRVLRRIHGKPLGDRRHIGLKGSRRREVEESGANLPAILKIMGHSAGYENAIASMRYAPLESWPRLAEELMLTGMTAGEAALVMGGNMARVASEVWRAPVPGR
jgi:hypothetical protein